MPESERDSWLGQLSGDDTPLAPTLRELLARQASRETADLLERPPAFTVAGVEPGASERALGRIAEARDAQLAALDLRVSNDDERSIWRAMVEIALAEAELSLGDVKGARRRADAARQRLAHHATMSPDLSSSMQRLGERLAAAASELRS